ncbi:MAG: ligand-binding protein [Frankiales bacterium]|nr:ligand-binding protein [Frankiales bacterium]
MAFLMAAITFEILGTSLLKGTQGFTRLTPTLVCLTAYAASFALFSRAVLTLPVGLAYALWSGLGTVAIVAIGMTFLGERLSLVKAVGIGCIVVGVVVINLDGRPGAT